MQVIRTIADLRSHVATWRRDGHRVGLVPTMGALHPGHASLIKRSAADADRTVVTIFVNPTQFSPQEDFATYPRDEARDLDIITGAGGHLVFAPEIREVYRDGHRTKVEVQSLGQTLEGEFRPHFFVGVATIVAKLLIQALPDIAVFGEKDYQQLCVIRQMAQDLDIPTEIIGAETVREPDGLAMSSRNRYLSNAERIIAPAMHAAISQAAGRIAKGANPATAAAEAVSEVLSAGFQRVDYIAARDAETLREPAKGRPMRILATAWLGQARLIDNVAV
ncbi:MAG: pantoate--beta-alanine ligase [Proteobacteria bacterium]|nr:pantoate--beta-alanine ligase [Pseudomonadota bacterium]